MRRHARPSSRHTRQTTFVSSRCKNVIAPPTPSSFSSLRVARSPASARPLPLRAAAFVSVLRRQHRGEDDEPPDEPRGDGQPRSSPRSPTRGPILVERVDHPVALGSLEEDEGDGRQGDEQPRTLEGAVRRHLVVGERDGWGGGGCQARRGRDAGVDKSGPRRPSGGGGLGFGAVGNAPAPSPVPRRGQEARRRPPPRRQTPRAPARRLAERSATSTARRSAEA